MNVEILNADGTPVRTRNPQRSRRGRRSPWSVSRAFVAPILLAIAIPLSAGLIARVWASLINPAADELPAAADPIRETESAPAAGWTRIVYPYSIVPGGVHSARDAREAVAADPIVASHYRDIVVDALHLETVTAPRAVYVSYRRGNDVYWTRRKLRCCTRARCCSRMGRIWVRARCGNRVSDARQSPVSDVDPPEEVLGEPAPIVVPEQDRWRLSAEWEEPATFTAFKAAAD